MTTDQTLSTPLRGRAARDQLTAELLSELRHFAQTQTAFVERLAGQAVNNVLDVRTHTFDATGQLALAYGVAAGCIAVSNPTGNATVTVSSAGPGSSAPTTGVGVYQVPAGTERTVALASTQVTLYGTSGQSISFQVFTAAIRPGTG